MRVWGEIRELHVDLINSQLAYPPGAVKLLVKLEPKPREPVLCKDIKTENLLLHVKRIHIMNFPTDAFVEMLFGKVTIENGLYTATQGNGWVAHTDQSAVSDGEIIWPNQTHSLDMSPTVSVQMLKEGNVAVNVCQRAPSWVPGSKPTLIARGIAPMIRLGERLNGESEVFFKLQGPSGQELGNLLLITELIEQENESLLKIDPTFEFGSLSIESVQSVNLKNTNWITSQSPYVELELDGWKAKTKTMDHAGGNVMWAREALGDSARNESLYKETVSEHLLKVIVKSSGIKHAAGLDDVIGQGEVSLLRCGAHIGTVRELEVTLTTKDNVQAGKVAQ